MVKKVNQLSTSAPCSITGQPFTGSLLKLYKSADGGRRAFSIIVVSIIDAKSRG